jgi:hypothetical protein
MGNLNEPCSVPDDEKLHVFLIPEGVKPALDLDGFFNVIFKVFNQRSFHVSSPDDVMIAAPIPLNRIG